MKTLKATQRFDAFRRSRAGKIEEDELCLDDISSFKQASSTSLFNDYGFSDDEEQSHGSFKTQNSLYFDSLDLSEKSMTLDKKDRKEEKKEPESKRSSGALEDLFASGASAKSTKRASNSNTSIKISTLPKSRPSSALSELRRKSKASVGSGLVSTTDQLSSSGHSVLQVYADEYETDTDDDDDDDEFASDAKEVPASSRRKSAVKGALKIATAPLKGGTSKTRPKDALSLSLHRQDSSEKRQQARERRFMDALTISRHSTRREEASSAPKCRSVSLSGPRLRRSAIKKQLLEGSDATEDNKLRQRSSSLSGPRQRSSSFSGPRQWRSSMKKELFDYSDMPDHPGRTNRSSSLVSARRQSVEHDVSTTKVKKRRSSSAKPKRNRKKGLDQSTHSTTGDDERSQRSGKKKQQKKKNNDLLDRSSQHSQKSSAPKQRRVSSKRSSINIEDEMMGPGSSQSLSVDSEHETQVRRGSKKFNSDGMLSPNLLRRLKPYHRTRIMVLNGAPTVA